MTSDCCCTTDGSTCQTDVCVECGTKAREIDTITLKALLTTDALKRLESGPYHFCSEETCDAVYFNGSGSVFGTADVTVPVWQKTDDPYAHVCYCFEHSEDSMRKEVVEIGSTNAPDEIKRLIQEGKCACEVRNPQGTCCLGNVVKVVKRLGARSTEPA